MNKLIQETYGPLLNYFHASLKLDHKEHHQGKVRRIYGAAQTPLARVLDSTEVSQPTKQRLRQDKARLNPFAVKLVLAREERCIPFKPLQVFRTSLRGLIWNYTALLIFTVVALVGTRRWLGYSFTGTPRARREEAILYLNFSGTDLSPF